jgi:hypothetical protein
MLRVSAEMFEGRDLMMAEAEMDFGFSETIVDELTNGDCWSLAGILHQRTGFPFAAIHGDGEVVHVGIEIADGVVVDIEGIWDSGSWETHWVDILDDVWEIYYGFVPDDMEDKDALLGYSPSLKSFTFGEEALGSIADKIVASIHAFSSKNR